ncbi:MAG: thioesterase family protein [Anaerolineales bacterium]|jgi:acyl-CoA thioesterase FadM
MPIKSEILLTTRISDLDALRHVNNRIYAQFCAEGRYQLLKEHGYPLESLLAQGIYPRPTVAFVRFSLQQMAGTTLTVKTDAFPLENGIILWDHQILQPDGAAACQVQVRSVTVDRRGNPVDLLPHSNEAPEKVLIEEVPAFSGSCQRVTSPYSAIYTDMDAFGQLPFSAHWRMFEEGRHMFGQQLGLTLARLMQLDTHIFWVSGTYQVYKPVQAGQMVKISTWLERVVRIRAYFRQEIRSAEGDELLGASREEHLVVSLSKARARTLPPEMLAVLQDYIEYSE